MVHGSDFSAWETESGGYLPAGGELGLRSETVRDKSMINQSTVGKAMVLHFLKYNIEGTS